MFCLVNTRGTVDKIVFFLARGHRVLACGESVQSDRSVKQEPTEAAMYEVTHV
jgi:hypothetical protein